MLAMASGAVAAEPALSPAVPAAPRIGSAICNVIDYGAEGQRLQIALNTTAFQKAIDDCAARGGGTVEVPAGNYLVNPLFLKSHIRLHLAKEATLVASSEITAYRADDQHRYAAAENGWLPVISIADATDVAITGEGTIDGQGAVWWERWRENIRASGKKGPTDRPRLIYITRAERVLVDGVTLVNSPSFHLVMRYARDVTVNGTTILSPHHAPNTDAIDPIDSRHVRITNNVIDCNDDHIAIKSEKADSRYPNGAVEDIYIANNHLRQGRGISIGSETAGGISNVLVENNQFTGSMYGIRIKSPRGKGGEVNNVLYRQIHMTDVAVPLVISGYYQAAPIVPAEVAKQLNAGGFLLGEQLYPPDSDASQPFNRITTPHFSRITIRDLTSEGNSLAAGYIIGVPEAVLNDIQLDKVSIQAKVGLRVRNAQLTTRDLSIEPANGPALLLDRGAEIQ